MDTDERAALQARGIGLAKTHVYIAAGEDKEDPDVLVVSMADYFQGETFTIEAHELDVEFNEGAVIEGTEGEESAGKIAESTEKICGKDTTFTLPMNRMARVKITYLENDAIVDITPGARSGWIDWINI